MTAEITEVRQPIFETKYDKVGHVPTIVKKEVGISMLKRHNTVAEFQQRNMPANRENENSLLFDGGYSSN